MYWMKLSGTPQPLRKDWGCCLPDLTIVFMSMWEGAPCFTISRPFALREVNPHQLKCHQNTSKKNRPLEHLIWRYQHRKSLIWRSQLLKGEHAKVGVGIDMPWRGLALERSYIFKYCISQVCLEKIGLCKSCIVEPCIREVCLPRGSPLERFLS